MTVDHEMQAFQADLMEAVRDMKAGRAARVTQVKLSPAADARAKTGLSQSRFAALLGVSARTLQNWEQGRTQPSGAAQTLLAVAQRHPEVLRELVA
ncbi:helix-turn-helix domain-containing protein [Acidovorax sp. HDW3]|uniref:helix-turn-helix domain-containing protein n=1 Tax=Acidovorax sp. HDW3 TaxID=2714923 RepID=UPI00140A53A3|nr:helix-turn-helix domain-containing protein [Acidovorax sp. HDW3]QIL44615.1 helix-turn-helix domain-containing protein [Acidovorax sp. HDW3]